MGGEPHQLGGTYYEPTLLTGINPSMMCYREEIFGPVAMTITCVFNLSYKKVSPNELIRYWYFLKDFQQRKKHSKSQMIQEAV